MELRIAGTVAESIVDGPGIRYVIFTQGCTHNCKGCHNPSTHSLAGGKLVETADLLYEIEHDSLVSGVTFSGGEPFLQPEPLADLAEKLSAHGYDIMCYTGYTYEQLCDMRSQNPSIAKLLSYLSILVDGPFVLSQRSLSAKFKGSTNQRIINVQSSLELGHPVLAEL